jgi:hypothetical protein
LIDRVSVTICRLLPRSIILRFVDVLQRPRRARMGH